MNFASNWPLQVAFEWNLRFSAAGYRGETIVDKTTASKGLFDGSNYTVACVTKDIFLEPLKSQLELSGEVKTGSSDLGLLSTDEIARSLGVPANDILDLVKSGKLHAKQIGSKYFVTKKEFQDWLERK